MISAIIFDVNINLLYWRHSSQISKHAVSCAPNQWGYGKETVQNRGFFIGATPAVSKMKWLIYCALVRLLILLLAISKRKNDLLRNLMLQQDRIVAKKAKTKARRDLTIRLQMHTLIVRDALALFKGQPCWAEGFLFFISARFHFINLILWAKIKFLDGLTPMVCFQRFWHSPW